MWDKLKNRFFGFELKFGNGRSWKLWTKKMENKYYESDQRTDNGQRYKP